jgi:hypothetical protein
MRSCYNCGAELPNRERVPFKELCPKCDAFLHCCRNCRLYSPTAQNHCLSSTTEHVPDVERGNYCDEFEFRQVEAPEPTGRQEPESASSGEARAKTAREKFEQLFKD